jgi:glycosyltransferase involved in cell wall biosynthesis
MKVVVAALTAPENLNGVSRHAANLVRGLLTRPEISEVHMLAGDWQQRTYVDAVARQDARLHIHPVKIGRSTLRRNWWYYAELPKVAAQLNADIVHLAYPSPMAGKDFPCPTIVTLHDLYPFDIPDNFGLLKSAVNRQVVRQCLQSVDAIACVSESTRKQLARWLGAHITDKAFTVPNSVEPIPSSCARAPKPLHKNQPFLLCVAQHRRNKNIPLALEIFEQSLRTGAIAPETQLAIVGVSGPETETIERRIRSARLERCVVILSGISDSELQWCYRNCELLLAPSIVEGFGLPVVEALLAGCKVVCSDIAAFREVGTEGCRYVQLGDGELDRFTTAVGEMRKTARILPVSMPWLSASVIAEKYIILYRRLQTRPVSQSYGTVRVSRIGSGDGV